MRRTPNRHIHAGLFAAGVIWLIALAVAPAVLDETHTPGDAAGARAPLTTAPGAAEASAPIRSEPGPGEAGHEPLNAPAGKAGDIDDLDASAGASGSASGASDADGAGSGSVVATGWAPGAFHGVGGGSSASITATGGGAPSVGGSGGAGIGGPVGGGGASAPGGPSGLPSAGSSGGPGGGSGGSSGTPTQTDAGQGGGPAPGSSTPPASTPNGGGSGGSGGTPTQTATGPAPSTTSPNSGPGDAGGTPPSNVISGTDPVDGDLIIGPDQIHQPGHSPGQQTVSGDYVLDGLLEIDLGGTEAGTEYDQIVADGAAILNGTIDVRLIDDFMPETNDIFDIIIASSFSFGDEFEIFFPDLTGDRFLGYSLFDLGDERTAFRLTTHEELVQTASTSSGPGIAQTTPIPEPSTLLVLSLGVALAAAGLVAVRRRPAF